jgi:hypothetical protein
MFTFIATHLQVHLEFPGEDLVGKRVVWPCRKGETCRQIAMPAGIQQ